MLVNALKAFWEPRNRIWKMHGFAQSKKQRVLRSRQMIICVTTFGQPWASQGRSDLCSGRW